MALKIRDAGILRTIKRMRFMDAGALRSIKTLKVMDNGTLRLVATFADALSAVVNPSRVTGTVTASSGAPSASVPTGLANAVVTGGLAPFSYAWSLLSTDGATPSITNPTSASTRFTCTVPNNETVNASFRVTVTDSTGATTTADCTAGFTYIDNA